MSIINHHLSLINEECPGLESNLNSQSPNSEELSKSTNSERVQNRVHKSEVCAELQQIITAWPELSEHIKAAIKALIQTHKAEKK